MAVTVSAPPTVVISPTGVQGPRGNATLNGTGAPGPTDGVDGDYWIDKTNYPTSVVLYGPKAAGAWPGTGVTMGASAGSTPTGPASGDLTGTYPGPTVAKVNGVAVAGTPSAGQVPTATSGTAATWQTPATSLPPNGAASGDLSGTYPAPTVAKVNGIAVTGTPTTGYVPTATGTTAATWQPLPAATASASGLVQFDGTATDIQPLGTQAAGTTGKAADAGHTHPTTGVVLTTTDQTVGGIKTFSAIPLLPATDPTSDNHAVRKSWVDQQDGWSLADYQAAGAGIKAWTGGLGYSTTGATTFGQTKLNKLWLRTAATLSTVNITITTAGVGLTSGQNFVAILDANGNQVAISADQTTAWGTAGLKATTMTTPYNAAAGGYYVALLCNGATTPISVACHGNSGSSMLNFGLPLSTARALQTATGQTSIPASIPLASQNLSSMNFMAVIT